MDHEHVEQHHLVHRYLTGNLSSEEQNAFEDHYLDCPECLAELERAESLHRGLEGVALETLRAAESAPRRSLGRFERFGGRPAAVAAAAILVLLLPLGWLLLRTDRLQDELTRLRAPRVGAAVAYLSPLRGETPPDRLILPREPHPMVFVLDVGLDAEGPYRVSLGREGRQQPVWSRSGVSASRPGELTVSVSTAYFTPGDYAFQVARSAPDGSSEPVARFHFRAVSEEESEDGVK